LKISPLWTLDVKNFQQFSTDSSSAQSELGKTSNYTNRRVKRAIRYYTSSIPDSIKRNYTDLRYCKSAAVRPVTEARLELTSSLFWYNTLLPGVLARSRPDPDTPYNNPQQMTYTLTLYQGEDRGTDKKYSAYASVWRRRCTVKVFGAWPVGRRLAQRALMYEHTYFVTDQRRPFQCSIHLQPNAQTPCTPCTPELW